MQGCWGLILRQLAGHFSKQQPSSDSVKPHCRSQVPAAWQPHNLERDSFRQVLCFCLSQGPRSERCHQKPHLPRCRPACIKANILFLSHFCLAPKRFPKWLCPSLLRSKTLSCTTSRNPCQGHHPKTNLETGCQTEMEPKQGFFFRLRIGL